MLTLFVFVSILSIIVLIHEFGHFIVAKLSNVKVEEFGFGFPPKLLSIKFNETIYSINAVPFGGFVRLYGEDQTEQTEKERSFLNKPKKVRASIITAGVIMNFVLGIVAFTILYSFVGVPKSLGMVKVIDTSQNSPAKNAGLMPEDVILKVDNQPISTSDEFIQTINSKKGKEVNLGIKTKDGEEKVVNVTPRENPPQGEGSLGVVIKDTEIYYPPLWQRPFWGLWYGVQEAFSWGVEIIKSFALLFRNLIFAGQLPKDIAGPVGIFQITGGVAQEGFLAILHFLGILSINIGVLNILPIPALDGGRLFFIGVESVLRGRARELLPKYERIFNMVGFAVLIAFLIVITLHDITRLLGR